MDRLPYRIAIDRQPEAIAACRRAIMGQVAELDVAALQRGPVVLTGVGASLYAAEVAAAQMRQQGLRAFALPAAAYSTRRLMQERRILRSPPLAAAWSR